MYGGGTQAHIKQKSTFFNEQNKHFCINNSKFKSVILFFLINVNKWCLENWQMLHAIWDITVQSLVNLYCEQKFETSFSGKFNLNSGQVLTEMETQCYTTFE